MSALASRRNTASVSLSAQFEGDVEISRLLDDCRQKRSEQQDARDRMRSLGQERRLFELEELLAKLRRSGTIVKGMEEYGKQLQEKLSTIRSELARTRALLASGEHEEAIGLGQWILEHVADCPEVDELVRQAREQIEAGSKRSRGRWLVRFVFFLLVAGGVGYATKGLWFKPEYSTLNYWFTLVFEGNGEPGDGNPPSASDSSVSGNSDTLPSNNTSPLADDTTGNDSGQDDPLPPD